MQHPPLPLGRQSLKKGCVVTRSNERMLVIVERGHYLFHGCQIQIVRGLMQEP